MSTTSRATWLDLGYRTSTNVTLVHTECPGCGARTRHHKYRLLGTLAGLNAKRVITECCRCGWEAHVDRESIVPVLCDGCGTPTDGRGRGKRRRYHAACYTHAVEAGDISG